MVILGLVMGFGIYGTVGTINKSKVRAEKIFVSRLSKVVDEYIDLNRSSYVEGSSTSFSKCNNGSCVNSVAKALKKSNGGSIYIQDLIEEKFLSKEDVINPANDLKCFSTKNPEIKIFRDSDYVYYYYINLKGNNTNCKISDENGIISTLTDDLAEKVGLTS